MSQIQDIAWWYPNFETAHTIKKHNGVGIRNQRLWKTGHLTGVVLAQFLSKYNLCMDERDEL